MPVNWALHKDVIRELYLSRGYTLEELRRNMSLKHGVTASPRTYKMKLDEWNMRKNRRKKKTKYKQDYSKSPSPKSVSGTSDSSSPSGTASASVEEGMHISGPSSAMDSTPTPIEIYHQLSQLGTVASSSLDPCQISNAPHNIISQQPSSDANDLGPIVVNSSLMFFSSRTDSQSLQLLAQFPEMAPRAIEILLRNWKPGGEYMHYALRFLKESACCHTLLSVNWTRWTHQDETLFDLIDEYVPEGEQVALTTAVLRADLTFQYPLEPLHAAWASEWRLALQQTEWNAAKDCLLRLEAHARLIDCALQVVGESIMRQEDTSWIGTTENCSANCNGQEVQILSDCKDMQAGWNHRPISFINTGAW